MASYLQAAQNTGHRLLIVSDSKHSLVSAIATGITIDFAKPDLAFDTIIQAIEGKRILAVISTDDLVVTLSSRIAHHLGLPCNHPDAALLTRRKDLARLRLQQTHCNVPDFRVCDFSDAHDSSTSVKYPVVLKPLMLSGSRGVIRANNQQEFISAAQKIEQIVTKEAVYDDYECSHFLIEEYLFGDEVALDGFMQNGTFIHLALFDKPEAMEGPFFEESYYITPSKLTAEKQQKIINEVEKACQAYGLSHGPIHAEARLTERGVIIIEIASRSIGGQCAQVIEYVLGTNLEEAIIRLMCFEPVELTQQETYAGVLMIPITRKGVLKRVEGVLQAQKIIHITQLEIHIQPGYELIPLPEGASYLGFIFSQADTYEKTYRALQLALQELKFITSESWALEPA